MTVINRGPASRRVRWAGLIGWVLIALALTGLWYELGIAARGGAYRMIAAGELWFALDVASLNLTQAVVQRYVHPFVWDPVVAGVLQWPLWSLLGAPGAALAILRPVGR